MGIRLYPLYGIVSIFESALVPYHYELTRAVSFLAQRAPAYQFPLREAVALLRRRMHYRRCVLQEPFYR